MATTTGALLEELRKLALALAPDFVRTALTRVVHTRTVLAHVPQQDKAIVAAAIRTIFAQPHQAAAKAQRHEVDH